MLACEKPHNGPTGDTGFKEQLLIMLSIVLDNNLILRTTKNKYLMVIPAS